jgi:hypothetical protein
MAESRERPRTKPTWPTKPMDGSPRAPAAVTAYGFVPITTIVFI